MTDADAFPERPELIFAMVGPLGTRLDALLKRLSRELQTFGYEVESIRVSQLLAGFADWTSPETPGEGGRVRHLQGKATQSVPAFKTAPFSPAPQ